MPPNTRLLLLLTTATLAACTPPRTGIPAMTCPTIPPPREHQATPPAALPAGTALAPGHWEWSDGSYAWVEPAPMPRPPHPHRPGAPVLWQNGYWTPDGGACVWTAGSFVS